MDQTQLLISSTEVKPHIFIMKLEIALKKWKDCKLPELLI